MSNLFNNFTPFIVLVRFDYKNVSLNASLLMKRFENMEILRNSVASFNVPVQFKLPCHMPEFTPFQKIWGTFFIPFSLDYYLHYYRTCR